MTPVTALRIALAGLLLASGSGEAHHSFSVHYDASKRITKEGVATLGTTLRAELQTLRVELQAELQTLRVEMQTLRADFTEQLNRQIKWLVTFAAAWTSLLVTLVRLIP